jgi:transcriptional regulator NrdR family protein
VDCPACGCDKSRVIATVRWPASDIRKQECCNCKYQFQTIAMLVDMMAVLESCALASRKYYEARDAYAPQSDQLQKYEDKGVIKNGRA